MRAVWKFPIPIDDIIAIKMPEGADLLHFGLQNDEPTLWALVDPASPLQERYFRFAGTGHLIANRPDITYVGTAVGWRGKLVWHLFEII